MARPEVVGRRPPLSVVVPALDEAAGIGALLADLAPLLRDEANEVVVVDGGSRDATAAIAEAAGARVVQAPRGRGLQLRAGAAAARAGWLLFLHADVRVSHVALGLALDCVEADRRDEAYWFRLAIDGPGVALRLVERAANLRSRLLGLPYGDQGLLVHRTLYDAVGGFDAVPLMEDVALVRRLARTGRLREIRAPLLVSPRRWQRDGVVRRTLRNQEILLRWLLGASPERLAERYR